MLHIFLRYSRSFIVNVNAQVISFGRVCFLRWARQLVAKTDFDPPAVTITRDSPASTQADSVTYSVIFNEIVGTSFDDDDVTVTLMLAAGAEKSVTGSGSDYTVTLTPADPDADGDIAFIIGTDVFDLAANPLEGATAPAGS